jgi:hypothetical protein
VVNAILPGWSRALATLKPRQAVAVGRGFGTDIPVIFQIPEIQEPEPAGDGAQQAEDNAAPAQN